MTDSAPDDIATLRCWRCSGVRGERACHKCSGTGTLFWAGGYAYPYTPEGEKQARAAMKLLTRLRP